MDPVTAALERSFGRLASKIGLDQGPESVSDSIGRGNIITTDKENSVGATAPTVKTAAESTHGSQLQTMQERGDYSTHAQELGKQKSETHGSGKEGTDPAGSQLQTMETKDKNYTLSGPAAIAMRAVKDLAIENPKAAAKLLRIAADDAAGDDLGEPMGGEPDVVAEGKEELDMGGEGAAPPAVPDETPGGSNLVDSAVAAEIQKTLNDLAMEKKIDQEVMTKLKSVLQNATGMQSALARKAMQTMAIKAINYAKAICAVREIRKKAGPSADTSAEPAAAQGNGVVEHSSVDRDSDYVLGDGDGDASLAAQANATTSTSTESSTGQEYAGSSDRDYKLGSKQDWDLFDQVAGAVRTAGLPEAEDCPKCGAAILVGNACSKCDAKKKAVRKTSALPTCAVHARPTRGCVRCKTAIMARIAARKKTAGVTVHGHPLKKRADERSPDALGDNAGGDKTTRYEAGSKGDTSPDDISGGNAETLESPATSSLKDEARGDLNRRHNEGTRGSTVASTFKSEEKALIKKKLAALDETYKVFAAHAKIAAKRQVPEKRVALKMAVQIMKTIVAIRDGLKQTLAQAPTPEVRKAFVAYIQRIAPVVKQAQREVHYLDSINAVEKRGVERLQRISPAFTLAIHQVEQGQYDLKFMPTKVAEYSQLSTEAFEAVARNVGNLGTRQTQKALPGMRRTAARLPSLAVANPADLLSAVDELDGIFDD